MQRRDFIGGLGSAVAWSLAARAQQGEQMRRVGALMFGSEEEPEYHVGLRALRDGLQTSGNAAARLIFHRYLPRFGTLARVLVF